MHKEEGWRRDLHKTGEHEHVEKEHAHDKLVVPDAPALSAANVFVGANNEGCSPDSEDDGDERVQCSDKGGRCTPKKELDWVKSEDGCAYKVSFFMVQ